MKNRKWKRKGLIYKPSGEYGWINSHAQVPTAILLGDTIRVYISTRTIKKESKTTFIDLCAYNPKKIKQINSIPILDNGSPGCFDEHGIMPSAIVKIAKDNFLLYYSGWSQRCSTPYSNLTGVAESVDCIHFNKLYKGPILSTNKYEPFSATSPCIIEEDERYFMFYCSGTDWKLIDGKYEHTYDIKLATSENGLDWTQDGMSRIKQKNSLEALTRPSVIKLDDVFHMWFCYRGSLDFRDGIESYRIGYASSKDLFNWERNDDNCGIEVGQERWEDKMIAYPNVISTDKYIYMFYNGNGFGESGFGYAILE